MDFSRRFPRNTALGCEDSLELRFGLSGFPGIAFGAIPAAGFPGIMFGAGSPSRRFPWKRLSLAASRFSRWFFPALAQSGMHRDDSTYIPLKFLPHGSKAGNSPDCWKWDLARLLKTGIVPRKIPKLGCQLLSKESAKSRSQAHGKETLIFIFLVRNWINLNE